MEQPEDTTQRSGWSTPVECLQAGPVPSEAINLNVQGKQLTGPLRGFGRMWQKTFRIQLAGVAVTPEELIATWKANFERFWPEGNRFYGTPDGIQPGEVAVLNLALPGSHEVVLATGVLVLYADDTSFAFMTPVGHPIAGWITFSAYEEDGSTVVQAQSLIRASDPLYELGERIMGEKLNNQFWIRTVQSVAAHYGVHREVEVQAVLVDPRVQWANAGNIWQNAGIRTAFYKVTAPFHRKAATPKELRDD